MDLKDKIVVITGGAQGIGRCIAEEFEAVICNNENQNIERQ